MRFEYDPAKHAEVLEKHGIDLEEAALIFERAVLTRIDDREDYGEQRFISLGMIGDDAVIVVHTPRGDRTRLITAWWAGEAGRKSYENAFAE